MNNEKKIVGAFILLILCMGITTTALRKKQFEEQREAEIIVIGKRQWSKEKIVIETATGRIYILFKQGTEDIHPGEIYRIIYKSGIIVEFEKLGTVEFIAIG